MIGHLPHPSLFSRSDYDLTSSCWWHEQVDLGSVQEIRAVQLVNRADCCQDRLVGARIVVSQTTDYEAYNEARPFDTMSCGSVDEAESPIDEQEVIIKACEPGTTKYDIRQRRN